MWAACGVLRGAAGRADTLPISIRQRNLTIKYGRMSKEMQMKNQGNIADIVKFQCRVYAGKITLKKRK